MSEELFDVPVNKSPRLRWIEARGLHIRKTDPRKVGTEDCDGEVIEAFYVSMNKRHWIGGPTEDDALAKWARVAGVPLWNEEAFAK